MVSCFFPPGYSLLLPTMSYFPPFRVERSRPPTPGMVSPYFLEWGALWFPARGNTGLSTHFPAKMNGPPPGPSPNGPARPPFGAHRVFGHSEQEVSLAVVLNLRNGPLMSLQQDRLLWGQDRSISARISPCPNPIPPTTIPSTQWNSPSLR